MAGVVGTKDDGADDPGAAVVWAAYGYKDIDEEDVDVTAFVGWFSLFRKSQFLGNIAGVTAAPGK